MLLLGLLRAAALTPQYAAPLPTADTPLRQLTLNPNGSAGLPDNIQLQNLWQSYSQMQAMNPKADAEADTLNAIPAAVPKTNRLLKTSLLNRSDSTRHLEGEAAEGDASAAGSTSDAAGSSGDAGQSTGDDNAGSTAAESVDDIIERLLKRVDTLDDKIDHLLFHNHHDLAGMTAYYTPYGVQMLPSKKPKDSVDQKLKMVDYMHNLGGGYNPMLHTMLPYYLGQEGEQQTGIKMNGVMGAGLGVGARKKKLM